MTTFRGVPSLSRKRVWICLLCLITAFPARVALCAELRGQQAGESPSFSVNSTLVRLLVSVRDATTNRIITGLNKEDFSVLDEGEPQSISIFERNTSLPLSIAVLVDTSGSTRKDLNYETTSILKFLKALKNAGNAEDALAVYSFNYQVRMETGFIRNEGRAERALRMLHAEAGTSLYDAVYLVSDDLAEREGRHVMIVVTDGGDTTSYKKFDEAVKSALRSDVVLYPIVVIPIENSAGRNLGGEHALDSMAQATGGRTFYPAGSNQLDNAFADILRELRTQYLLGYYPKTKISASHRYHRTTVRVSQQNMKIVTRAGYYEP